MRKVVERIGLIEDVKTVESLIDSIERNIINVMSAGLLSFWTKFAIQLFSIVAAIALIKSMYSVLFLHEMDFFWIGIAFFSMVGVGYAYDFLSRFALSLLKDRKQLLLKQD